MNRRFRLKTNGGKANFKKSLRSVAIQLLPMMGIMFGINIGKSIEAGEILVDGFLWAAAFCLGFYALVMTMIYFIFVIMDNKRVKQNLADREADRIAWEREGASAESKRIAWEKERDAAEAEL